MNAQRRTEDEARYENLFDLIVACLNEYQPEYLADNDAFNQIRDEFDTLATRLGLPNYNELRRDIAAQQALDGTIPTDTPLDADGWRLLFRQDGSTPKPPRSPADFGPRYMLTDPPSNWN